jgi:hypothetical protein
MRHENRQNNDNRRGVDTDGLDSINPISLIDGQYLQSVGDEPDRFPISGSSAGDCPRKTQMLLMGVKPEYTARSLRIFERGHAREAGLAEKLSHAFGQLAIKTARQMEVWSSTGVLIGDDMKIISAKRSVQNVESLRLSATGLVEIRSRCDLVAIGDGRANIYEFKTASPYSFKKFVGGEGIGVMYATQAYLQVTGLEDLGYETTLTHVYECSATSELAQRQFDPDEYSEDIGIGIDHMRESVLRFIDSASAPEMATATYALDRYRVKNGRELPWQCTYCSVGPVIAKCVRGSVAGKAKADGLTVWEVM